MVKDRHNQYLTELTTAIKDEYPKITSGAVFKATPPSFPYMYFRQVGGSTALTTLSATEEGITLALEIKFYSKTAATEARQIANVAREYLIGAGFHIDEFHPIENAADSSIFQFLVRCSKLET